MVSGKEVTECLRTINHPKLQKSLVDLGLIRNISLHDNRLTLDLALKSDKAPIAGFLVEQIKNTASRLPGISEVQVNVVALPPGESARLFAEAPLKGIREVKHFLAVASGKGGVGKTTVAVNVALALVQQGYKVGLLDADVYGPSIPLMLNITEFVIRGAPVIVPVEKYGLQVMSFGMTAGKDEAFIWRGPLVAKMIKQMLGGVRWGELDYLIIDLPPGTGDPSITIAKSLPQCSILMVTTPQEVALADVRRAITLFKKTGHDIVGLVENMSYFLADNSGTPIEIFGKGGGEKLSRETDIPLIGALPLDLDLRKGGDNGVPLMVSAPDSSTGRLFREMVPVLAAIDS